MSTIRATAVVLTLCLETAHAASTVLLSAIPNPAVLDAPVSLTATVVPSSATGKVTFYDGVSVLGIANLTAGVAILNPIQLPSGNLSLRAYYAGDSVNPPATSQVFHETVNSLPGNGFQPLIVNYAAASAIAAGDFNGDGKQDLAAVDGYQSVTVLLGNGDGTFSQSYVYTESGAALGPSSVAAGDLNGDGYADLVVSLLLGDEIIVFLGKGDGTFKGPFSYSTAAAPNSGASFVALGDFNGDGIIDIASTGHDSNSITIFLGKGDGTLNPAQNYPAGSAPVGLTLGDFNGDGITDAATANNGGDVTVMLGNGDGTFGPPAHVPADSLGGGPYSVVAADFNGDGNTDLAVGTFDVTTDIRAVVILLGHGDGTFSANSPMDTGGLSYVDVASGDFNGDGIPDLAASTGNGAISLFLGSGTGSFQMVNFGTSDFVQQFIPVLAVADFNEDGITDVAVAQGGGVIVYLGAPPVDVSISKSHTGTFNLGQTGATFTISVSNLGPNTTVGTVTMNDTPPSDFTVTAASGTGWSCTLAVQCVRNDPLPAGAAYPSITVTVTVSTSAAPTVTNVATVSAPGDTNPSNNTASDVVVVVHPQTITFGTISPVTAGSVLTLTASASSGLAVSYAASGNCTVAGNVVTATAVGSCTITASQAGNAGYLPAPNVVQTFAILPSTSSIAIFSSGSPSTFGGPVTLTATVSPAGATGRVTFYDGPTILGARSVSSGTAALSVKLYSTGTRLLTAHYSGDASHPPSASAAISQVVQSAPSFGFSLVQPAPGTFYSPGEDSAAVGDFNGDGLPDIVTGAFNHNNTGNIASLAVYLNGGDGTFKAPVFSGATVPYDIVTADFNADGKADVATIVGSGIIVQFGNGDGSFGPATGYPMTVSSIIAADLNGDGYPDLVTGFVLTNSAAVLLNKGDGTFYPATEYTVQGAGSNLALAIGDVNGDGKPDMAIASLTSSGNVIAFLPGNGDGTFGAPVYTPAGPTGAIVGVALGDLNGDGKPDVVIDEGIISVSLGNGDGTFAAPNSFKPTNASAAGDAYTPVGGEGTPGIAIVDVNGDGIPDIGSNSTGLLQVFLGNGDGTLQQSFVYPYGGYSTALALTNFNGDGRVDLVSAIPGTYSADIQQGGPGALLSLSMSNPGNIYEGEIGVPYSIVVSNAQGASQSSGTVSVTEFMMAYGIESAMSGPGWSCSIASFTCTRSDSLSAGASYPPISLSVNIPAGTPSPFTNSALVFGGGAPPTMASDTVPILPAPANCPVSVNPTTVTITTPYATTGSFSVNVPAGCSWSLAVPVPAWLTFTSPIAGTNAGVVSYSVAANNSSSSRSTYLDVVNAGDSAYALVQITQAGVPALQFYPVAPCRLADTRGAAAGFNGNSPFSGPSLPSQGTITIPVQSAAEASANTTPAPCGVIPSTAQAYSFNLTVAPAAGGAVNYISLWPAGSEQPVVSTLDDPQGLIVSNAAIVPAGSPSGGISVYNDGPSATDVILDMNGYFAPPGSGLEFYPVAPCRLVDTRGQTAEFNGIAPFSGPSLQPVGTATIPVQSATEASTNTEPAPCGVIPSGAQAYSFNLTVVPTVAASQVDYVSLWPAGSSQPVVSTLDDPKGLIVSNAAIVPAGTPSGGVGVFNAGPAATDVILDMNGYFAAPTSLRFYPVAPCRLVDTRGAAAGFNGIAPFSGPSIAGGGTTTIPVQSAAEASTNTEPAPCGVIPSAAQAYSINLTVVPAGATASTAGGRVDYVSLWPAGSAQPFVSTLDDPQGLIVSNAAIVPAGAPSGGISVYNAGPATTDVVIDINGYFAP